MLKPPQHKPTVLKRLLAIVSAGSLFFFQTTYGAVTDVTTYHYNNARDGLNATESILTLTNVNATSFGKLSIFLLDGKVDAQPLYLSSVPIGQDMHNVLYAVTEHDSVYALDADTGQVLWQRSMLSTGETPSDSHGCSQISPEIGITSTPVIQRQSASEGLIFLVAMSKDATGAYHQRLHALNMTTGAEMEHGPQEISASFLGNGEFSQNGRQIFDPGQYAERVGLLLMHGAIFMGWTSHCDIDPYTGWLMMYDARTLRQRGVLNLTPNGSGPHFQGGEGSIWQSGAGLAGDLDGYVYFLDANGSFDEDANERGMPAHGNYGNAFMKVSTMGRRMLPEDFFSPYNTASQSVQDLDLGSGGVLLLPDLTDAQGKLQQLAVGAGKDGNIYVVNRHNMGKFSPSGNNIYQELDKAIGPEFGMAAYFNNTVYYGGKADNLKAFTIQNAKLGLSPSSKSAITFPYPGTTPSISANGTTNGIVWALESNTGLPAVLHAYDAIDLTQELYNSNQAAGGRDSFGQGNKYITPMIANGKVFVGTTNGVAVFGLLNSSTATNSPARIGENRISAPERPAGRVAAPSAKAEDAQ